MRSNIEKEWTTKEGYRAVVLLNTNTAFRWGYVGIPPNHKAYGLRYYTFIDVEITSKMSEKKNTMNKVNNINIHNGLTYSGNKSDYPRHSSNTWWFGFDAGHGGSRRDYKALSKLLQTEEEIEKALSKASNFPQRGRLITLEYMIDECNSLSKQLFNIDKNCDTN